MPQEGVTHILFSAPSPSDPCGVVSAQSCFTQCTNFEHSSWMTARQYKIAMTALMTYLAFFHRSCEDPSTSHLTLPVPAALTSLTAHNWPQEEEPQPAILRARRHCFCTKGNLLATNLVRGALITLVHAILGAHLLHLHHEFLHGTALD